MEIRVAARDELRLVPHYRMHPQQGLPVKFHKTCLAFLIDEPESMHPESLHHTEAARNGAVGHDPHDHVHRLGRDGDKIPKGIVRRSRLRDFVVGFGLDSVNEIGELDGVLDEKNGHIVAHQVKDSLLGVKLHGKTPHVAGQIGRTPRPGHGGEAGEYGCFRPRLQEMRPGRLRVTLVSFKNPVGRRSPRMDYALGNALVVEVGDFFAQDEVFQQRGAARSGF